MAKNKIEKKFKCGLCSFKTNDLEILNDHYYDIHHCTICGSSFYSKIFHQCITVNQVGRGRGAAIEEPVNENGEPFFHKESQSFRDAIAVFSYDFSNQHIPLVEDAVNHVRTPLLSLLKAYLNEHGGIRVKLAFEMLMHSPKLDKELKKKYPSSPMRCLHENFLDDVLDDCINYVTALTHLLSHEISGLHLLQILKMTITILKYKPKVAEGYLPNGPFLSGRHGILNVKQNTGRCFLYAVISAIYYDKIKINGKTINEVKGNERMLMKRKLENAATWEPYIRSHNLQVTDQPYGEDLSALDSFEDINRISVSVYKYSKKAGTVVPIRLTKRKFDLHVTLLLLFRIHLPKYERKRYTAVMHFACITDASAFFSLKRLRYLGLCRYCGGFYKSSVHEDICFTNDFTLRFPKTTNYKYTEGYRLCIPPTFFVYDFLMTADETGMLKVSGFGLVGISSENKILFSNFYIGSDALNKFYDQLFSNAYFYLDKLVADQIPLSVTKEEREAARLVTSCYACGKDFGPDNPGPVFNHDHYINSQSDRISYPCQSCNTLIYPLRKMVTFGYGLNKHLKYLLSHLSEKALKSVYICPQRATDTFISMTINRKILFLDAEYHFNNQHLHDLLSQLDDDDLFLMKNSVDSAMFSCMRKGLVFPHTYIKNDDDWQKQMPKYEDFCDVTKLNSLKIDQYDHAIKTYTLAKCENMKEYGLLVLQASVYGLSSLLTTYARWAMDLFGVMPLYDPSLASFSYGALHYVSKTDYEHLKSPEIIKRLESSLCGGISLCNVRNVECKSSRLGYHDVSPEDTTEVVFLDFTQLYCGLSGERIPYSDYRLLPQHEVKSFNVFNVNDDDDTWYICNVSLLYPRSIHALTQDFPLAFSRTSIKKDNIRLIYNDIKSLLKHNDHTPLSRINLDVKHKERIWISHRNLRLFLKIGMQLVEMHEIISYKIKAHLAPFVKKCVDGRKSAKNSLFAGLAKNAGNLSIGKFIQSKQQIRVAVCTSEKSANRLLAKSTFMDAQSISPNLALISMKRKKSFLCKNTLISYHILMESKYRLYDVVYNYIKPLWRDRVSICYIETDSLILRITQAANLLHELYKLKDILDMSSVPKDCFLYDDSRKQQPLLLKFEAFYIKSYIALRSKCLSILEVYPECSNHDAMHECTSCTHHISKGVKKVNIAHQNYRDVLNKLDAGYCAFKSFSSDINGLKVTENHRKMLSLNDHERIWLNINESRPHGFLET